MLYRKYQLYDERIEIMIPSELEEDRGFLTTQYSWATKDNKVIINVMRGASDLRESSIFERLDKYYRDFMGNLKEFECESINRCIINTHTYGVLRYSYDMTGYRFYNIFILGCCDDRELIVTLQCMNERKKEMLHIFDNIADSIRIKRKTMRL